jgi:hypothetical protein
MSGKVVVMENVGKLVVRVNLTNRGLGKVDEPSWINGNFNNNVVFQLKLLSHRFVK